MTIPNDCGWILVKYHPEYSTLCTIGKRPFYGHIDIEFFPEELLLEFGAFETWLHGIALSENTVESLCRGVFDLLTNKLGEIPLRVEVHAKTTVHAPVSAIIERK
jgi:NADPH-dependent 7-cyano-7-deazaguanine reductase QueF